MKRTRLLSRRKQFGITLWHVLLLVVVAVSLALCAKTGTIPYFQQPLPKVGSLSDFRMPRFNSGSGGGSSTGTVNAGYYQSRDYQDLDSASTASDTPVSDNQVEWLLTSKRSVQAPPPPDGGVYELQFPRDLPRDLSGGFYTVQVFSGYNSKSAYDLRKGLVRDGYRAYIVEEPSRQGVLFKVRIGRYTNRSDAFAMNSKIRLSYPKQMGNSFVLLRH